MTTKTVCVPRDELSELLEDGVDDYWITTEDGVRIVETLRAILAQPVASEPVAWQWLNTAHFRRKIPAYANACHWEPLYRHPPAPAIPDGYALVPIEPTPEMLDNVDCEVGGSCYSCSPWKASYNDCRKVWAAMLAATTQPTEGPTNE